MTEPTDTDDAIGGEGAIDEPTLAKPVTDATHEVTDDLGDEAVDGQPLDWVKPGETTDASEFDGGGPMDAIRALFGRGKTK